MQTRYKMQTKNLYCFFVWYVITCHLTTYLASRNRFFTYIHYVVFGLHEEPANFLKEKRSVAFLTGHLFTFLVVLSLICLVTTQILICENQIIWRLEILLRTIVAALLKTKCNGRYVKNKGYQETGKEYFAIVHMIEKDEGYKYFAAWATFDARSCRPSPPSAPHTHKVTLSANKKDTACLMTSAHPTSSPHNLISNFHHDKCTSFLINCPNRKGNLFHKSWNFIWTEFNCAYIQQVQEIDTNLMHNMNELAPRALWFFLSGL